MIFFAVGWDPIHGIEKAGEAPEGYPFKLPGWICEDIWWVQRRALGEWRFGLVDASFLSVYYTFRDLGSWSLERNLGVLGDSSASSLKCRASCRDADYESPK